MRAMKTFAKKKEHANASIGPFTTKEEWEVGCESK
jgi:hypothetical protein